MATPPYAKLLVRLDGGQPLSGGITSASVGQSAQLSVENPSGITQYRWEIYDYPPDFELPDGWDQASDGTYFSTDIVPAAFTLTHWGDYLFALYINDAHALNRPAKFSDVHQTAIRIESPNGLTDLSFLEKQQFDLRGWPVAQKKNLRALDQIVGGEWDAENVDYDNTTSGLAATDVQAAIDEISEISSPAKTITVTGAKTLSLADWDGADPAQTLLIVLAEGSGDRTITLPTDDARVAGARVLVVKGNTDGAVVTVNGIVDTANSGSSVAINSGGAAARASAWFASDGSVWAVAGGDFRSQVKTVHIAASAVTTAKIDNLAVTTQKIANNAVSLTKMASIAAGTVLGNVTSGAAVPAANAPNDYAFENTGFSLKVAPQHIDTLEGIADSGDDATTATLSADGIYLFTVLVTATGSSGSYLVAYKVRGQLASGTLTLGTPVPIEDDDTGDIDLSFADDSGALEVTVSNTSGVTVNALVAVGWLFCPVPAAP